VEAPTAVSHAFAVATGAWYRALAFWRQPSAQIPRSLVENSRGSKFCQGTQEASRGRMQAGHTPLSMHFSVVALSVIDSTGPFVNTCLSVFLSKLLLCGVFELAVQLPVFNIIILILLCSTNLSSVL